MDFNPPHINFCLFFFHFHFPWLCAGVKNQNVHCKLFFRIYCWTLLTKVFICSRRSGEGGARVLRSTPDWGDGAVSGEHLWTPTSVSGDCCYVGDAECQVYIRLTDPRQGRHFYSMKAGLCVWLYLIIRCSAVFITNYFSVPSLAHSIA